MNGFEHNIQDIAQASGLSRKYIDRCYEIMPFLEDYRRKSPERNKYFYNSGAFGIFQHIASLKQEGCDRHAIKRSLEKDGLGNEESDLGKVREEEGSPQGNEERDHTESEPPVTTDTTSALIQALKESNRQALAALNKTLARQDESIREKENQIQDLKKRLLALPDGRTPEQLKADLEAKEEQERELAMLKAVDDQREKQAARRRQLLDEYEQLPRWGKGKRKREILTQLSALDAAT